MIEGKREGKLELKKKAIVESKNENNISGTRNIARNIPNHTF